MKPVIVFLVTVALAATASGAMWSKKPEKNADGSSGKLYWYNEVSGVSQWAEPKYTFTNGQNATYFLDPVSNETVWERPESLSWRVETDDKGKTYYYNEKTGKSQWEKPLQLAWKQVPVNSDRDDYEL